MLPRQYSLVGGEDKGPVSTILFWMLQWPRPAASVWHQCQVGNYSKEFINIANNWQTLGWASGDVIIVDNGRNIISICPSVSPSLFSFLDSGFIFFFLLFFFFVTSLSYHTFFHHFILILDIFSSCLFAPSIMSFTQYSMAKGQN